MENVCLSKGFPGVGSPHNTYGGKHKWNFCELNKVYFLFFQFRKYCLREEHLNIFPGTKVSKGVKEQVKCDPKNPNQMVKTWGFISR